MIKKRIHIAHGERIEKSNDGELEVVDYYIDIPEKIFIDDKVKKLFMKGSFGYLCDFERIPNADRKLDELKIEILSYLSMSDVLYKPCYDDFRFIKKTKRYASVKLENGEFKYEKKNVNTERVRLRKYNKLLNSPYLSVNSFEDDVLKTKKEFMHLQHFAYVVYNFFLDNRDVDMKLYNYLMPVIMLHYLDSRYDCDLNNNILLLQITEERYKLMFMDRIVVLDGLSTFSFSRYESHFKNRISANTYNIRYEVRETFTYEDFKCGKAMNMDVFDISLRLMKKIVDYEENKLKKE